MDTRRDGCARYQQKGGREGRKEGSTYFFLWHWLSTFFPASHHIHTHLYLLPPSLTPSSLPPSLPSPPPSLSVAHLYEYTLDLSSSCLLSLTRLFPSSADSRGWEFPQVDGRRAGRRTRFLYATPFNHVGEGEGFVKVDLERGEGGREGGVGFEQVRYEEGTFGGEVIFVPREGGRGGGEGREEDDGYLLTFVHSYLRNVSEFRVYNAKTMEGGRDGGLVASVELPRRVPWGFHGLWVGEEELKEQQGRVCLRKGRVVGGEGGGEGRKEEV